MKPKAAVKMIVDILMTAALLFLMGYQFWGDAAHEWAGAVMFVLFIPASYFEPRLVQSPAKGKIFSGAGLSVCDKFAAVIGHDGTDGKRNHSVALCIFVSADQRRNVLCPPASYGGRVLGLCADGASSGAALEHGVRKTWKGSGPLPEFPVENHCGKDCRNCTCGLWTFAFISRDLPDYMFLRTQFVFMDFSEPVALFYLDYLAMMGFFIFAAHYLSRGMKLA